MTTGPIIHHTMRPSGPPLRAYRSESIALTNEDTGQILACLYYGSAGECTNCGGAANPERMDRFCTDGCADSYQANAAEIDRARQQQRDKEDAFAAACDHLRGKGYTDLEIDVLLEDWPT
jgi:hypothetical protein